MVVPHTPSLLLSLWVWRMQQLGTRPSHSVSPLDYWSRLKHLEMYSQEMRVECYKIPTLRGGGRIFVVPPLHGRQIIQSVREYSFQRACPNLFNSLPRYLRDIRNKSTEEIKEKLDNFLTNLPDQPMIGDIVLQVCNQITAKPSNSLKFVILHQKRIYGGGCAPPF